MQRLAIAITFALAACAHGSSTVDNSAQTTTGTPHMAQANERQDPDVTCKTEQRTGTHLDKRVCRTQSEKDLERHSVETMMLAPVRKR